MNKVTVTSSKAIAASGPILTCKEPAAKQQPLVLRHAGWAIRVQYTYTDSTGYSRTHSSVVEGKSAAEVKIVLQLTLDKLPESFGAGRLEVVYISKPEKVYRYV